MELFSQRYGFKPVKTIIQVDGMDSDLRNGLWNALEIFFWSKARKEAYLRESAVYGLFISLRLDYFKLTLDTMPNYMSDALKSVREYFFGCKWSDAYSFVEFIANDDEVKSVSKGFMKYCNSILQREVSGYRFVGGKIAPVTSQEEIAELEEALDASASFKPVAIHVKTALDFLSDRKSPDYRNSIKESISAVEAACRSVTGKDDATLGQALKVLNDSKIAIHPALEKAFSKLYGYTSDAEGIRHALLDEPSLDFEDAKFMLVSCAAFINYLKLKASKAGVKL